MRRPQAGVQPPDLWPFSYGHVVARVPASGTIRTTVLAMQPFSAASIGNISRRNAKGMECKSPLRSRLKVRIRPTLHAPKCSGRSNGLETHNQRVTGCRVNEPQAPARLQVHIWLTLPPHGNIVVNNTAANLRGTNMCTSLSRMPSPLLGVESTSL
jgi:hypothetical protein